LLPDIASVHHGNHTNATQTNPQFPFLLPVKFRFRVRIKSVHGLRLFFEFLDPEHEKRWKAQNRRQDEAEENRGGVMVLGAKTQASVRMSE
jgi:hypothetical protein